MMKKKTQAFALVLFACAARATSAADYATVAAAHGGSLTSPRLRSDVNAQIRAIAGALDSCHSVAVRKMSVTQYAMLPKAWTERWTIVDCGHVRPTNVHFKSTPDGGADFGVEWQR